MGLRNAIDRIRDSRSGATTHPLGDIQAGEAYVADTFGDEPEDTDPGGADLTDPAAIPAGAIRSVQTKYGPDVRRCPNVGCGTPTTGEACSVCIAAGRIPAHVDVYVAPGLERILPDPPPDWKVGGQVNPRWLPEQPDAVIWRPLGLSRSSWLTEAILDGPTCPASDDPCIYDCAHLGESCMRGFQRALPTLDECPPFTTTLVRYPGGDAA